MGLNPRQAFDDKFLFLIAVFKSEDKNLKFFMFFLEKMLVGLNPIRHTSI